MHAMIDPTAEEVASDPEWLPHTFDVEGNNLMFVHVPRAARQQLLFLTDEYYEGKFSKASFPANAAARQIDSAEKAPIHFIFHTSFCCSTLLAKALDMPGVSTVLREPAVLFHLANRLIKRADSANHQRIELVVRLLERPLAGRETVLVKPTNFSNRLVDVLLTLRPGSKAILLYSDLESFIQSLLMRGIWGRVVGRRMYNNLSSWSGLNFGYDQSELLEQTDVQIAALSWLMHIHHFDGIAKTFGRDRVMILDSANLIADPVAALNEVQALFGLDLSKDELAAIANGPAFSKHSKLSGHDYSVERRQLDHEAVVEKHGEELSMVTNWLQAVASHLGAPLRPNYRD